MDLGKTGRFLAQLRHEKGLTQEQLGAKLGVTNKTVSRWENGNYSPDIEMLQLLSAQFDVTISELIAGERLSDAALRERSNELVVDAAKSEAFSVKEKTDYWKKKWLREHRAQIVLLALLAVGTYLAMLFLPVIPDEWRPLAGGCWALACMCGYGWMRNKMMIYVEDKVYGKL